MPPPPVFSASAASAANLHAQIASLPAAMPSSASTIGSSAACAITATPLNAGVAAIPNITPDAIVNSVATLVGAIIGALVAALLTYLIQHWLSVMQERKQALLSAHRTMFSLLQQINTIVLIQRDYVHSELDSPARYISIPATPPFDPQKNVLRIEDLTFLLDSGQGRQILYELYIAQENYVEALNQWNLRSSLHVQNLQPALAALKILPGTSTKLEDLEMKLGPLLHGTMVNITDNCLITLRRAFEKLSAANTRTRSYLVKRFKSEDFTKFDFPDTYGLLTKNPS